MFLQIEREYLVSKFKGKENLPLDVSELIALFGVKSAPNLENDILVGHLIDTILQREERFIQLFEILNILDDLLCEDRFD